MDATKLNLILNFIILINLIFVLVNNLKLKQNDDTIFDSFRDCLEFIDLLKKKVDLLEKRVEELEEKKKKNSKNTLKNVSSK